MHDAQEMPTGHALPDGALPDGARTSRKGARGKLLKRSTAVALTFGTAIGATVGAAAIASAVGGPSGSGSGPAGSGDGSGATTRPAVPGPPGVGFGPGGRRFGELGGLGGMGFGIEGPGTGPGSDGILHGELTIKAPSGGYETLELQNGTVSSETSTSGGDNTLVVNSADGTSVTYTVDSGTTVDGGETGISSVKGGDTVHVLAVVTGGTSNAKEVLDQTVMQANRGAWAPVGPQDMPGPSSSQSGSSSPDLGTSA